jgi:hypothetical protein
VRDRGPASADVSDLVIRSAEYYCGGEFIHAGLHDRVFDEVERTFWGWVSKYESQRICTPDGTERLLVHDCVRDGGCRDRCLNKLCDCSVFVHGKHLAQTILRRMAEEYRDGKISAHLLDMVFQWTGRLGCHEALHRDHVFVSLANNRDLLNTHWIIARDIIKNVCPAEYHAAVEKMVCGGIRKA